MMRAWFAALLLAAACSGPAAAQGTPPAAAANAGAERVVDILTREGVTQRFLLMEAKQARAVLVVFAGGDGGLRLSPDGAFGGLRGNFLVRARQLFVDRGLSVALIDAPSDRQRPPYLGGFRQSAEHVEDVRQVMLWLRSNLKRPVWLIGTSRGTQSAAGVATRLADPAHPGHGDNADGIVLTSTILTDRGSRPVPNMPLDKLTMPVLVVHHEQDGCALCRYSGIPELMQKLTQASRKDLQAWRGGVDRGDPCEALAYHGFNGLEEDVVAAIAAWIR